MFRIAILIISLFLLCTGLANAAFIDNGDGTVTDTETGLMWQQKTSENEYIWEDAITYCDQLSLSGYDDWYLPTKAELLSLTNKIMQDPSIESTYFPNTPEVGVWSSTTDTTFKGNAWHIYFDYRRGVSVSKSYDFYVRAVRETDVSDFSITDLTVTPTNGTYPLEVTVKATASGGSQPYSYSFDFGAGTTQETENATVKHTYTQASAYEIVCTVTDNDGHRASLNTEVIVQEPPCTFDISPEIINFDANGGNQEVGVNATGADCEWSVKNDLSWVSLTPQNGIGNGSVQVSIEPNDQSSSRTGTVTIAGEELNLSQASANISKKKAIICTGGSLDKENNLIEESKLCSDYAFKVLRDKGYKTENIKYLSPHEYIDADGDGNNDVSDVCIAETLSSAIKDWATDAEDLVIYLNDHGWPGKFIANQGEKISAEDLDDWLDGAQSYIPGETILIYDACFSGSFLEHMTAPSGKDRIVITSSGAKEETHYNSNGTVSFGYQFWASIFHNPELYPSYARAKGVVQRQQPILDANGDNFEDGEDERLVSDLQIGSGKRASYMPTIGSVSGSQLLRGETATTIWAKNLEFPFELEKVWAVIIPPDLENRSTGKAVTDLETVELHLDEDGKYKGTYDQFRKQGDYEVSIYAKDVEGNLALPKSTRVVQEFGEPVPSIQVNGRYHPVTITREESFSVSIHLEPGRRKDLIADVWIVAQTPLGWKSLVINPHVAWVDRVASIAALPLSNFSFQLPPPDLPQGTSTLYFVVDDNDDGIPDITWWDSAEITVE